MTTILEALELATSALTKVGLSAARLDAQVLLGHVLQVDRVTLIAYPEKPLTAEQERHYYQLLERRKRSEPVAYLIGHKEFFGLDFFVDQRVLIPRPETEQLVEAALKVIRVSLAAGLQPVVADIGTGSGVIPITIAVQEPRLLYLYASDVSSDALEVARINCRRHYVEGRVRLLSSDLFIALPEPIDVLTANLPYIGTDEMDIVAPEVRAYEPHLALFSGNRGLDLIQRFFTEALHSNKLKEHAVLLLEIGYQQRETLLHVLNNLWPHASVSFEKDYAGWDRLLKVVL